MVVYLEVFALLGIFRHLYAREQFFDFCLDAVNIHVAHNHDALQIGAIPCFVVVAQSLVWEVVNHIHCAYRQAIAISAVRVDCWQQVFNDAHLSHHAHAPFFVNHLAFRIDFLSIEQQTVSPVAKDNQTGVLHTNACCWHLRDVVHRLVDTGIGIDVSAELNAHRFAPLEHIVALEGLGAVEAHVLKEVSQTALVVFFNHRTHLLRNIKLGLSLRIVVVTDVISQSICQFSYTHCSVNRDGWHALCIRIALQHSRCQQCNEQHFLDNFHFLLFS